jgi:hypothetical protein
MKTMLIATVSAAMLATSAAAADLAAEIGVDVTKNDLGNYIATPSVELSFGSKGEDATAFGGGKVIADDGVLVVDEWYLGVNFGATAVSFGDQGDLFDFGGLEVVGGALTNTNGVLADPEFDNESVIVRHGDFAGLVGFANIGTDVGDIENVQLSYAHDYGTVNVIGAVDYKIDGGYYILAVAADSNVTEQVNLAATVTYDSAVSVLAYETVATYDYNESLSVAGFLNGDEDELAQNIGAGVVYTKDGLKAFAEVGYDLDTDEVAPAVGVSFSF